MTTLWKDTPWGRFLWIQMDHNIIKAWFEDGDGTESLDDLSQEHLDPFGSPFQRDVWNALRTIPYGETSTYARVAQQIGKPKAMRAVGQAIGANPIAYLIPCHRVIRSNGDLGGYRWGVARKKKILASEGCYNPTP